MLVGSEALVRNRIHEEYGVADRTLSSVLKKALEDGMSRAGIPGAQVAVRRDGELLWSACAGKISLVSQSESQCVVRSDRFVIASVTKLVISIVTMSLVERDGLQLEATIDRWLPDIPNADLITIQMLLSHRSGFQEYFKDQWLREQLNDAPLRYWSRREIIDAIARLGPEEEPGKRFAYRNSNYLVLGEILELFTGKSIGKLVENYVSRPLGLDTLSFEERLNGGRLAAPYIWRPRRLSDSLKRTGGHLQSDAVGEVWTDGGIASSAEDLATLTDALFCGRLLTAEMINKMSTPPSYEERASVRILRIVLPSVADNVYGLGMTIEKRKDSWILGHNGMYLGWSAITSFDTRSRVTVTVLTNLAGINVPAQRLEKSLRVALA